MLIMLSFFPQPDRPRWLIQSSCGSKLSIPAGSDVYHRGCAYTVLQTVRRAGVCSAVYGTVHYD